MSDVADEITITVKAPLRIRFPAVEWNNTTYDNLVVRAPTGGELRDVQKNRGETLDGVMLLICKVSGTPMQVVTLLPQPVIEAAAEYLGDFSQPSRPVGQS